MRIETNEDIEIFHRDQTTVIGEVKIISIRRISITPYSFVDIVLASRF